LYQYYYSPKEKARSSPAFQNSPGTIGSHIGCGDLSSSNDELAVGNLGATFDLDGNRTGDIFFIQQIQKQAYFVTETLYAG
jgi:hypothetical protein